MMTPKPVSLSDYKAILYTLDSGLMIICFLVAAVILIYPRIMTRMAKVNFWYWLLPLALIIRLPRFTTEFWYDESFTNLMSLISNPKFATALLGDVHPPLHYLIARVMRVFGDSDYLIRMPSLIAGLFFIYLMYRFVRRISDEKNAFWTSVIVTFLPATIHYSGEARYPIFLACAVVGMALCVVENRRVFFVVCGICAVGFHNLGLIYASFLCIYAIYRYKNTEWMIAVVGVGVAAATWIPFAIVQFQDVADGFWLLMRNPLWLYIDMTILGGLPTLAIVTYPVFIGATITGFRTFYRNSMWILVAVLVPGVLTIISVVKPLYLERAMLASASFVVITWAWLASRSLAWRMVLICSLVIVNVAYITSVFSNDPKDVTMTKVFELCDGADVTYTIATNMAILAKHFADTPVYVSYKSNSLHQYLSDDAINAMGLERASFDDVHGDICVVATNDYYTTEYQRSFMMLLNLQAQPIRLSDSQVVEFFVYRIKK